MRKKIDVFIYILLFIFLFSFVFRATNLFQNDFWLDESFSFFYGKESLEFITTHDTHPPLFYMITGFFPQTPLVRFFPLMLGVLSLFIVLLILDELNIAKKIKLWALFFCAINGYLVKYSQEYRMYTLVLFFSLLSFYFLLRIYNKEAGIGKLFYPIAFIMVTYLALLSHYSAFMLIPFQLTFLILNKKDTKKLMILYGILFIIYIPQFINMYYQFINLQASSLFVFDRNMFTIRYFLFPFSGVVILAVTMFNFFINKKNNLSLNIEDKLFYSALVPFILLYLTTFLEAGLLQPRYNFIFIPYFMIFIARTNFNKYKIINMLVITIMLLNTHVQFQEERSLEVYTLYGHITREALSKENIPTTVLHESVFSYYTWKFYDTEHKYKNYIVLNSSTNKTEWLQTHQTVGASLLNENDLILTNEILNGSYLYLNDEQNKLDISTFSLILRNESGIRLENIYG